MENPCFKVPNRNQDSETIFLHLGIPFHARSTVKNLVKRYCELVGKDWVCLDGDVDNPRNINFKKLSQEHIFEMPDHTQYMFSNFPFPFHNLTERKCRYYTTFRNPSKAIVSLYCWAIISKRTQVSIEEYVDELPLHFNPASRWFAGLLDKEIHPYHLNQDYIFFDRRNEIAQVDENKLYDQAIEAIEKYFVVIAPSEQMDEFSFALFDALKWDILPVHLRCHFSVKKENFRYEELPEALRHKINLSTQVDQKLHRFIRDRFASQIARLGKNYGHYLADYKKLTAAVDKQVLTAHGLRFNGEFVEEIGPSNDSSVLVPNLSNFPTRFNDYIEGGSSPVKSEFFTMISM